VTLAARNTIVQIPDVQDMVASGQIGKSTNWMDGWVFDTRPYAAIEKWSNKALLVVSDSGTWQTPNPHNTNRFPAIYIDVWASPTRNDDGSVKMDDAEDLIEKIMAALMPVFHTVNVDVPGRTGAPLVPYLGRPGYVRRWGTAAEIASGKGVQVLHSELLGEPVYSPVEDGNGALMSRCRFGLSIG
jgi:hypothetical protein